jgi:hypothetical protein
MRVFCMNTVEATGAFWSYIGWALFLIAVLLPFAAWSFDAGPIICLLSVLLLLVWWVVDGTAQMVPWWMYVVGVALMLSIPITMALGLMSGRWMFVPITCWVAYWTKVRE